MRLLYIVNQAATFFSHRRSWAQKAAEYGYDVHVAGPLDGSIREIEAMGFRAWPFPFVRGLGSPIALGQGLWRGRQVVQRVAPDVVHLVGTQVVATLGPLLTPAIAPVLVASVTGLGHAFLTGGARGALMQAITTAGYASVARHPGSRFVFQNPDDLETIRGHWPLGSLHADLIRGSGVDTSAFPFVEAPVRRPRVVFPARLIKEKGVHEFYGAVTLLKSRGVDADFVLVGDIDESNPSSLTRSELEDWTQSERLTWAGHSTDMATTLQQADVVVLPSYREGLPKSLLEAASTGRAIVATDVPGCREVVIHEKTGLLVPLGDVAALADALERLIVSKTLRDTFGLAGRRLVESSLSAERVSTAYCELYKELTR